MSTQEFEFAPPQITLSQYEYRIARLPKRKYPRRRRRRHIDEIAAIEEHQPEQRDISTSNEEGIPLEEPLPDDVELQLDQVEQATPLNNPVQSSSRHQSQHSYHAGSFTAPLAPMSMNEDDLELLELGKTSDNEMPRPDDIDDMLVLQELENNIQPRKTRRKRKSANLSSSDSDFVDNTAQRPKKKKKRASGIVLSWTNQLVMISNDEEDRPSFENEHEPVSSPPEDPIEDTEPQWTTRSKQQKSKSKKTVSGSQLRRQIMTKSSATEYAMPHRRRRPSGPFVLSRDITDVGDGFTKDEREILYSSVRKGHGSRARKYTLPAPVLGMGLPTAGSTTPEAIYEMENGLAAPIDDKLAIPLAEEIEEFAEEEVEQHDRPDVMDVESLRNDNIALMARDMRMNTPKPERRRAQKPKFGPIIERNDLSAPLTMITAESLDVASARSNSEDVFAQVAATTTPKHKRSCKTQARGNHSASTARTDDHDHGGEGFVAAQQQFVNHFADDEASPYATAFSRPGNLKALRQVPEHDELDEAIEDDEPWTRRSARSIARLDLAPTAHWQRPLSPEKISLGRASNATKISPISAQAAYPTPQTMTRKPQQRVVRQESPLRAVDYSATRNKHNRLVEDIMDEDADLDDNRPRTASHSPVRYFPAASTQLANSSMMLDNDTEIVWDGSIRPRNYQQTQEAGGFTRRTGPSLASREEFVLPQVSLKDLTRTVSHRFGTKSPEKGLKRTVSRVATSKPPFKKT